MAIFPEIKLKSKKQEKVRDILFNHYSVPIKSIIKMEGEFKARESEKKEAMIMNEAASKKISEIE